MNVVASAKPVEEVTGHFLKKGTWQSLGRENQRKSADTYFLRYCSVGTGNTWREVTYAEYCAYLGM